MSTVAYLSLGSNLGDRQMYLAEALRRLKGDHTRLTAVSSVYETLPQGKTDQPLFLNIAAAVETDLDARTLLTRLLDVERSLGRVRVERWGPRTIDMDLLLYGRQVIQSPELVVPHPRMTERAFVLVPLLEIAPDLTLPPGDEPLVQILRRLPDQGVVRVTAREAFLRLVGAVQ